MANAGNSSADQICPTYSSGCLSKNDTENTTTPTFDFLNDCINVSSTLTGGSVAFGYINQVNHYTVGSMNNDWANGCLSPVSPTYSSSLIRFGIEGKQS